MEAPTSDLADLLARMRRLTSAHLLGAARRITLRQEQAEEVLQDAFISIGQHVGSCRHQHPPRQPEAGAGIGLAAPAARAADASPGPIAAPDKLAAARERVQQDK